MWLQQNNFFFIIFRYTYYRSSKKCWALEAWKNVRMCETSKYLLIFGAECKISSALRHCDAECCLMVLSWCVRRCWEATSLGISEGEWLCVVLSDGEWLVAVLSGFPWCPETGWLTEAEEGEWKVVAEWSWVMLDETQVLQDGIRQSDW